MKKITVLISCVMALLCLCSSAYAFNYVHEDGFESNSLADYTVEAKNGAILQIVEGNENNVLRLKSTASNPALLEKSFDSLSDIAIIDMDFMRESLDSGSVRIMQIYDSAKSSRPFLLQAATAGLTVRVGEGTSTIVTPDYDLGVWVSLRAVLDFSTETYDVYVNGKLCCEGKDFFQSSSNAGIIQIQMDNRAGTTGAYVDNIAIYGINNDVLDNAILQTEEAVASYVIGQQTGNYSQTRYGVFKDKLKEIRDISRETLSNEEQLEAVSGLEAAVESLEKGRICSGTEAGTVDAFANEIVFEDDKSTLFTSDSIEYSLNATILDNFNNNYAVQPDWEIVDAPESVTLSDGTLMIPMGVQGDVKVKASVEDIYRSFTIYLRDYSKVIINKITASDGFVKVNGTVTRNSEDDININLALGTETYTDKIVENEDGIFECSFGVSEGELTGDGTISVSGEYVYALSQSFTYFGSDAADVALSRIQIGTDEDIKSTIRTFSKYINVDMKVFENNQQEYVEKIKAYMPYSSTEVFNNKLIDINLIIKITKAVRDEIEAVITEGLDTLAANGFDKNLFQRLPEKNKNSFLANSVGVSGSELSEISAKLNEIMRNCNVTIPVSPGGEPNKKPTQAQSPNYVITPIGGGGTQYEEPQDKPQEAPQDKPQDEIVDLGAFDDENEAEWAKDAIHHLRSLGIIEGHENYIRPNDPVTRGEIAKMLVEAFDIEKDAQIQGGGAWWNQYAQRGMLAGIIAGYENGDFGGDDLLIRQDVAVLLSRAVAYKQLPVYEKQEKKEFNDGNEIADYARQAVYDMQKYGILSGMGENMFAPRSYVTRAQAITAIYNALMIGVE